MMFERKGFNLIQDSFIFFKTKYLASKPFRGHERDHLVIQFAFTMIPVLG
jgi:hypothetical protein